MKAICMVGSCAAGHPVEASMNLATDCDRGLGSLFKFGDALNWTPSLYIEKSSLV